MVLALLGVEHPDPPELVTHIRTASPDPHIRYSGCTVCTHRHRLRALSSTARRLMSGLRVDWCVCS